MAPDARGAAPVMTLEVEALLTPLSAQAPCGDNLEYDPAFRDLVEASTPKPARVLGDATVPGSEPEWPAVRQQALALLARSRDLRICTILAHALLASDGLAGLADTLALIRGLLERYWDTVHPRLDADEDNDPTERVNSLLALVDVTGTLKALRETPLARSQRLGRVSLRDLRIAAGKLKLPENSSDKAPDAAQIEAVFMDCVEDELRQAAAAASRAREQARAIDALLRDKAGGQAPNLAPLLGDLAEIDGVLAQQLARRSPDGAAPATALAGEAPALPGVVAPRTGIASRDDVIRRLDELCDYYARVEPSSPIPLLLRRAQRLVKKDFIEIMSDLAPDALGQIRVISGSTEDKSASG